MTTFNSKEKNVLHYLTFVTFRRVPIFKSKDICKLFINALAETRIKHQFKLVAYVLMFDHVHLIVNPLECDIELVGKELKGISAKNILGWLKENRHSSSLDKLKRSATGKRNHTYSVWQKKVVAIDLWSPKFIRQKMDYIHLNPVRAELCDHPAKWKWSSYHAYLPHAPGDAPIEIDLFGRRMNRKKESGRRPLA